MSASLQLHVLWARRHWYLKRWRNPGPPWFINIEPTNVCNLRCTVCSHDGSRPVGFMDVALCRRLLRQAKSLGVHEARFFLAGEPLLHPQLPEFLRAADETGLRSCIHTNATRLDDRTSLNLIGGGLGFLSISFDGEDQETYERIQVGARFDDTLERIRRFLEIRDRYRRGPRTVIQVLKPFGQAASSTLSKPFQELFSSHPPDRFVVLHPHTWAGEMRDLPVPPRQDVYHPCLPLWEGLSVYWDGRVPLCCGDLNGRTVIANVLEHDLESIWYGDALRRARKQLAGGPPRRSPCRDCDAIWHRSHPLLRDMLAVVRDHVRS